MDRDAAVSLGQTRERMRRELLALHVPPTKHAYRRTRDGRGDERIDCLPTAHANGCAFVIDDPDTARKVYRVIDASGLEVTSFRKLKNAKPCADEWGARANELFVRAVRGDVEAAAALPAIAVKHRERA